MSIIQQMAYLRLPSIGYLCISRSEFRETNYTSKFIKKCVDIETKRLDAVNTIDDEYCEHNDAGDENQFDSINWLVQLCSWWNGGRCT